MQFEFATATRIIFGAGAVKGVGSLAKEFGRRALLVMGREPRHADSVMAELTQQEIVAFKFSIFGEPELASIEQGVAQAKASRCDLVIAVGGGSALDSGKAIAAMLTNPGGLMDYLEIVGSGKPLTKPAAPFIAIPTTAGTGSEVTRNAVLASAEHRVKVSLRSPLMLPKVALVDPELTHGLPPALTATTGLDALTQLIEPYVCCRANAMVDALCVEGIRRVARSLRLAFQDGSDSAARQDMSLASLFGGMALANAGLGAVHGFAGPIGGMFRASHGAICAALLPQVMATNLRALREREPDSQTLDRYQFVAELLTGTPNCTADDGVDWVRNLVAELNIQGLRTYGIRPEHVSELVEKSKNASSMKANPIVLSSQELAETLKRAL